MATSTSRSSSLSSSSHSPLLLVGGFLWAFLFLFTSSCRTIHVSASTSLSSSSINFKLRKLSSKVYRETRRRLNFNSLLSSPTYQSPYDRIYGQPVFSVTTAWGSPYMNMEKLSDLTEVVQSDPSSASSSSKNNKKGGGSISDDGNEYRAVVLFFLDPDDALGVHGEMKQMESMKSTDIRITSMSMSKALRQASNLGNGLVTGYPIDAITGRLKAVEEGGSLRYKIVPPKRQLYYAARCIGKERVGLFGASSSSSSSSAEQPGAPTSTSTTNSGAAEDAQAAVLGNSALEGLNMIRRREQRERKIAKNIEKMTPLQLANQHMEGYTGIPIFCIPEMKRKIPIAKRLICGRCHELPMFFNYEDMMDAWETMRQRTSTNQRATIPEQPPTAEVFNLWDVLTSMDRYQHARNQKQSSFKANPKAWVQNLVANGIVKERFSSPHTTPVDLEHLTFVPSSRSIQYKEAISARGNGKARLRPMR